MEEDLGMSSNIDINQKKILQDIKQATHKNISKNLAKIQRALDQKIEKIVFQRLVTGLPSIQGDDLAEIGVPDINTRLVSIVQAVANNTRVKIKLEDNIQISIHILEEDYSDVLSLPDAVYKYTSASGSGILEWLGIGTKDGMIGVGSLIGLIYALSIRFLAVGFGPVEQGLDMIKPVYQEVAITLSASKFKRLKDITLPLLRPSLATASMLVFIDVMKEMPATLLLRPFGFDTLAVKIFELTSEGEWERAALPAIMLVLIGLVPIFWMTRRSA